jgi:hypothetical protein
MKACLKRLGWKKAQKPAPIKRSERSKSPSSLDLATPRATRSKLPLRMP